MDKIKNNIFHGAHEAIKNWDTFAWHRTRKSGIDTHQDNSSQALVIDLFGTIKISIEKNDILNALSRSLNLPQSDEWEISLEWVNKKNTLSEKTPTQVDAMAESEHSLIFFECKFTERAGGTCSQTRRQYGPNKDQRQCNGKYENQQNPRNGVWSKCALTGKGIRYWDIIPEVFTFTSERQYETCPFKGPWYQWMRNMTLCWEMSRKSNKKPAFIIVYADNPLLPFSKKLRTGGWTQFVDKVRMDQITFDTVSYQKISRIVREASNIERDTFNELHEWIQNKIDRVNNNMGA